MIFSFRSFPKFRDPHLTEVVTGILPNLVTESNNNLCLGGGALNDAMQKSGGVLKIELTNPASYGAPIRRREKCR